MVRWLERNGYDVSYFTGVDADRRGAEILNHKAFLSVGHDEYWSGGSGPTSRRRGPPASTSRSSAATRSSGRPAGSPASTARAPTTARWSPTRRPTPTPRSTRSDLDGNLARPALQSRRPTAAGRERAQRHDLHGQRGTSAIKVPAADGKLRFWRNTSVASLAPGQTATLADRHPRLRVGRGPRQRLPPRRAVDLSRPPATASQRAPGLRLELRPGHRDAQPDPVPRIRAARWFRRRHRQWSWGLDGDHDRGASRRTAHAAGHGQPAGRHGHPAGHAPGGLVSAAPRLTRPRRRATITSRSTGANVQSGRRSRSAAPPPTSAAEVGGVEVSTDGGTPGIRPRDVRLDLHWTPGATGARRQGAGGRRQRQPRGAGAQVTVNVGRGRVPARSGTTGLWPRRRRHERRRARCEVPHRRGRVHHRHPLLQDRGNTGTHAGHLWSGGTLLAAATFSGETGSGWQQVNFATRGDNAGTTYVASYHAPNGDYAAEYGAFAGGVDNAPLHALRRGRWSERDLQVRSLRGVVLRWGPRHLPVDPTTGSTWSSVTPTSGRTRRHPRSTPGRPQTVPVGWIPASTSPRPSASR